MEFLDKSRSAQSRTNTTSSAPSPSLAPATIAFSAASNQIIDLLQSQVADPNALFYMNARSESELESLAKQLIPFLVGRCDTLARLLSESHTEALHVSEKTKAFWQVKKIATDKFLQVFEQAEKNGSELADEERQKREEYLKSSQAAWMGLKGVLATVNAAILGPYTLGTLKSTRPAANGLMLNHDCRAPTGDQLSIADLHLAAWITRIAFLCGATASEDGAKVVGKIEAHVGDNLTLPKDFSVGEARRRAGLPATNIESSEHQSKLAAFWDSMRERPSWKKVYREGLH